MSGSTAHHQSFKVFELNTSVGGFMQATKLFITAIFALSGAAIAQQPAANPADHSGHHAAGAQAGQQFLSEGEVRKVDAQQGKVTLRHGPLSNLDMPSMTMVFAVMDKNLLNGLKEGDKVRFNADKKDGGFVVTALEVVR